jgi:hypothetical protein
MDPIFPDEIQNKLTEYVLGNDECIHIAPLSMVNKTWHSNVQTNDNYLKHKRKNRDDTGIIFFAISLINEFNMDDPDTLYNEKTKNIIDRYNIDTTYEYDMDIQSEGFIISNIFSFYPNKKKISK